MVSGISSAGIAPPGALSATRVLSMEDAAAGFCGVMTSKESSRSSWRSKSKVKQDITATAAAAAGFYQSMAKILLITLKIGEREHSIQGSEWYLIECSAEKAVQ